MEPLLQLLAGTGNGTGFADLEDPTYDPEYVDTYELGIKADYLDGRGRVNVAVFYNDIEDNQFSVFSGTGFTVLNASTTEVTGVELEHFFAVSQNLRVAAAATWLDAEYGDDIPPPAEPGREPTFAPDLSGSININYERPLGDALIGFSNVNWTYRGEQQRTGLIM